MAYDWAQLQSAMSDVDESVRLSAAATLEHALRTDLEKGYKEQESLVAAVLPSLIKGIGDANKGVQVHSANCLELLYALSPAILEELRGAMGTGDFRKSWGAALVIARMGFWFSEMDRALATALGSADRDIRWAAANFSVQLGKHHHQAVEMVRRTLRAENPQARKMATYCLGAMGEYAHVEEALAHQLCDEERDVRRAAILAIDKLPVTSEQVRLQIATMRHDPDEFVRRTAIAVTAKFGVA